MLASLPLIPIFAFANRARGTRFYGLAGTTVGRVLSTFLMATATGVTAWFEGQGTAQSAIIALWAWASLYFWCIFAWDQYWSAAIGNPTDIVAPACKPVDWVMSKLPTMPLRLWGTIAMGLRQAYLIPFLAELAVLCDHPWNAAYSLVTLLFGAIYLAAGYAKKIPPIALAEYSLGACLGLVVAFTVAR